MLIKRQCGYSLIEMLMVLLLSSIMVLSISSLLLVFTRQQHEFTIKNRLTEIFTQLLFSVEKELRRSGFQVTQGTPAGIRLETINGQQSSSCVLISYDFNRNGVIDSLAEGEADWLGYRLVAGALEQQRGVADCTGGGWERISDPKEVVVADFQVTFNTIAHTPYFIITINGYWYQTPRIRHTVKRWVRKENV